VHVEDGIGEWDYGEYEGLKKDEIIARHEEKGLERGRTFDVWRDGCEGGDYGP
jgi:sedoheptulose-bisphosphatase